MALILLLVYYMPAKILNLSNLGFCSISVYNAYFTKLDKTFEQLPLILVYNTFK